MFLEMRHNVFRIELPIPFPLKTTNVYFIDQSPRTLIDTGTMTEAAFEALKKEMEAIGTSLSSIERILITHGHIDHYGMARKISKLSGARIYIHPIDYGRIRSIIHAFGFLKTVLLRNGVPEALANGALRFIESSQKWGDPLEEAFFLEDGDIIRFEAMTWKTIHCPGHSPGQICFHWPEEKILFSGDHLLKEITPNPILNVSENTPPFHYPSLKDYLASVKRIETEDLTLLLPGHGEEIRDPKGLIRNIYMEYQKRMEDILASLSGGEKTAFDIAGDLFPEVSPFEIFLGISEVLGHLKIMRENGTVNVREKERKDFYSLET
jgi:glyoxylase-like metal-dependent hydrolase (beta-lactamase superfamily II)